MGCANDDNRYGPTEVTIGMTMYPRVPANGKPSNIGPQFDNVGTYVFARGTETPVARGAVGELCASGKLVGKGYLNRPDLTAKSFPVLKEFGEKIYRTGDLVRLLHDGTFDFLGRADDQVKLRGQRLEIGEINQVMKKAAEEVHAVATLVLRHPKQQKDQLVSFVVLESVLESVNQRAKPEVRTDEHLAKLIAKLVAACKAKLPTYMVPTHFLPISHMPLSVNNKVDNKILKAVYNDTSLEILQQLAKREDDIGAWTESEERLRSILSDMTKLQPSEISRSSTIFELGLDSISVVGFTRRLLKAGFTSATASLVMQHPALSQLSTALAQATAGSNDKSFSQVEAARQQIAAFAAKNSFMALETLGYAAEDVERFLPCTPLQEGMIARFLDSAEMVYWNAFPMVISRNTDIGRLRNAWMTVMENTDMLRTCFADTPDGYIQVVLKNAVFQWEEVLMVNEDYQEEIQRRINNVMDKNKKLQRPPVELVCIRTPTRYILSLNIFHALYDGNSLPLILDDVKAAYNNEFTKRPLEFKDVLAHLLSTDPIKAREFWTANIASSSPLQVEKLLSSTPQTEEYSEDLKLDLAPGSLDAICKQLQCTPQSIFQAAWASILASYSGPVVTLGLVVSGRSSPIDNIEGVVGPTFNTIPGCFEVAGAASWEDLVKKVQRFNSESLPFHNTPLRSIQKWVKKKGLFETLFAYQKGEEEKGELWEIAPGKAVADVSILPYPILL
jgi:aryl carrier-like protein